MSDPTQANNYAITGGKLANRYFILVCLIGVCLFIGQNCTNNSIVLYLTYLGGDSSLSGMVAIPFAIAAILARLVSGYLADHLSRRAVMVGGLILFAVTLSPVGLVSALPVLFALRAFHGFSYSCVQTTLSAATLDTAPPEKAGTASGLFYLPFALSIAVCGLVTVYFSSRQQYGLMFLLLGAALAVGIVLALVCNYEKKRSFRAETSTQGGRLQLRLQDFFEPDALRPALVSVCALTCISYFNGFMLLFAADKGIPHSGIFFTVAAVVMLVFNLSSGRLQRKFGPKKLVVFTLCANAVCLFVLGTAPCFPTYLLSAVAYGLQFGCCSPALYILALEGARPERRGAASCTLLIANDIGVGLGTAVWGVVIAALGHTPAILCCAACLIVSACAALFVLRRKKAR